MEMTHTRISFGSQLRQALDACVADGRIEAWDIITTAPTGQQRYAVQLPGHPAWTMTAGETAEFLNDSWNFDIYIGIVTT